MVPLLLYTSMLLTVNNLFQIYNLFHDLASQLFL